MLKVEFHAHTADDRCDFIPHTAQELIDRAAELEYHALAITLHERQLDVAPLEAYARARGLVLLPGVERDISGKHVLLINFPAEEAEGVDTFDDLAALKSRGQGLVIAPHPFYPAPSCLHRLLERHAHLFDAVELNAMYTPWLNFNRAAVQWAQRQRKPLVGNGDVHRLSQLGTTFSWIAADADAQSICMAVRAGRVEVQTTPLGTLQAGVLFARMVVGGVGGALARRRSRGGATTGPQLRHSDLRAQSEPPPTLGTCTPASDEGGGRVNR